MAGHIDDVVGAAHDPQIAVVVFVSGIRGLVVAGIRAQIPLEVIVVVVPERGQASRRQRKFDRHVADRSGSHFFAALIENAHVISRHGFGARSRFYFLDAEADAVRADGPAGLGLPPVIDHRNSYFRFGPLQRGRITALAGEKKISKAAEVVAADVVAVGIVALDGPERCRSGEEHRHFVLRDDAPERAGIGSADRFSLVKDRRASMKQRRVDDVRMADHPADVGTGPEHLARLHAIHGLHRVLEGHRMASVVAHGALRVSRRSAGVEDVERIGGGDRHALRGLGALEGLREGKVARPELGLVLRALQDDATLRLVLRQLERLVEERLVGDRSRARLDAARGAHHQLRLGMVDAGSQLVRGETAEHHRVDGAQARAGEHGDHRLRDHRHVDDDAVPALDALPPQRAGEAGHLVPQLAVGDLAHLAGEGTVPDDRGLLAAALLRMQVDRVVAGVQLATAEPAVEGCVRLVEDLVPAPRPVDALGDLAPEALGVLQRSAVLLLVTGHRETSGRVCNHRT